ncbi:thioredoxin domain-containing protein [Powai lake megavirus]|uniref:Thioredoxin domain-containing protein n=1 Tax=Powai lake megavirus TaxID=1842663 RepID=A0A167RGA8_9VIRU|nr:thioredoxin domain-containing protein [Powai lake megavirus]ANB50649.1 thioredoxin domain-containing protein [Powai lake megavirus]
MSIITNNPLNVYLDKINSLKDSFLEKYKNNDSASSEIYKHMRIIHGQAIRENTLLNIRIAQNNKASEDDLIALSISDNLLDIIRKKINHCMMKYHEKSNDKFHERSNEKSNETSNEKSNEKPTQKFNSNNSNVTKYAGLGENIKYKIRSNGNADEISISNLDTEASFQNAKNPQTMTGGKSNNSNTTEFINNLDTEQADNIYSKYQRQNNNLVTDNDDNDNNDYDDDFTNQMGGHYIDPSKPVLVNYWADWCGVSRRFLPTWEKFRDSAKEKYANLVIRDVDMGKNENELQQQISKFGVKGYPTMVLYKDGMTESKVAGNMTVNDIHNFIDANLNK